MAFLSKIKRIFVIHWGDILQYRFDLLLWTLVGALTPLLSMAIWYSVSKTSPNGPPPSEVLVYYIALTITSSATLAWHGFFLAEDILKGNIIRHLMRPFGTIWHTVANNIVEKTIKIPTLLSVFILACIIFPSLLPLVTSTVQNIPYFFLSVALALVITFTLETSLGLVAFWLEDSHEIARFKYLFESVASGILIPYAFMPDTLREVLSLLPFRYMFSAPVEILVGQIHGQEILSVFAIQIAWAIALIFITRLLWVKGLKRYAVPGQ